MKIPLKAVTITFTKTLTFTPTTEMFELWDCPPDQEAFEIMMLQDFFDETYDEMRASMPSLMRASGDPMPYTDVQQFETHEIEWEEALDWEWESDWFAERENVDVLLTQAYQDGADAELEACCEWLESEPDPGHVDLLRSCATALRAARRPSLQSLKEKALKEMDKLDAMWSHYLDDNALSTIRRALEALPND